MPRTAKPLPRTLSPARVMALLEQIGACKRRRLARGKWAAAAWKAVKNWADLRFVALALGVSQRLRDKAARQASDAVYDHGADDWERVYCDAYRTVITVPILLKAARKGGLI
jgi:hypothetical protein